MSDTKELSKDIIDTRCQNFIALFSEEFSDLEVPNGNKMKTLSVLVSSWICMFDEEDIPEILRMFMETVEATVTSMGPLRLLIKRLKEEAENAGAGGTEAGE